MVDSCKPIAGWLAFSWHHVPWKDAKVTAGVDKKSVLRERIKNK